MLKIQVREAIESDQSAISDVVIAAFGNGQGQEIDELITNLLHDPTAQPLLSLVATSNHQVVGHVLFTTVRIEPAPAVGTAAILAPLAVHPDAQNQGVGGHLIREGLQQLQARGVELVFVLGYPSYYSRHGFSPAGSQGLEATHPIPLEQSDAWMVLELRPGILASVSGRVICAETLNDPKYWRE